MVDVTVLLYTLALLYQTLPYLSIRPRNAWTKHRANFQIVQFMYVSGLTRVLRQTLLPPVIEVCPNHENHTRVSLGGVVRDHRQFPLLFYRQFRVARHTREQRPKCIVKNSSFPLIIVQYALSRLEALVSMTSSGTWTRLARDGFNLFKAGLFVTLSYAS